MGREHFVQQLDHLRTTLLGLGSAVEAALLAATRALETGDTASATAVIERDAEIDALQRALEEEAVCLQATQQPVAGDLRLTAAVIAIASELERIGDYAKGIARRVVHIAAQPVQATPPPALVTMATLAQKMLRTSMEAFLGQDVALAHSLIPEEDQVDALVKAVRAELIAAAKNDPQRVESTVDLLDVAQALERVADRATNIGERVIYLATSATEELNP